MTDNGAWFEENQRALLDALARVRDSLERYLDKGDSRWGHRHHDTGAATPPVPATAGPSALDRLTAAFGLSAFERDVLVLAAGVELDGATAALCADAHGDPGRPYATLSLALAALPDPHWSALSPDGPLRRWHLVELAHGAGLTNGPLRIDERVLHFLAGVDHLDTRLAWLAAAVEPAAFLTETQEELAEQVHRAWAAAAGAPPVVQLSGPDSSGKQAVAAEGCGSLGYELYRVAAGLLPTGPEELDALARLWDREARLAGRILLIDADDLDAGDTAHAVAVSRLLETVTAPVLVSTVDGRRRALRPTVAIDVAYPDTDEQERLWAESLASRGLAYNDVGQLAAQFRLSATSIESAVADAAAEEKPDYWAAARKEIRPALDGVAQRVRTAATFEDLVVSDEAAETLHDIVAHVRQRSKVYERWGFADKGERGLGISALFWGPSGTGKTLAAEVVAEALHLDLYRVDLSQVVSKYIGETEKNLRKVFDAADQGGVVLLFDEADALFGKRSEIKDSHDRYANIEVSYLLQRMEAYQGLAILTTNMKAALDTAFLRRLRFAVQFPFPDEAHRKDIWRRAFPSGVPLGPVSWTKLARLNVAGGNIRNIAVHAAFVAAERDVPVDMHILLRAARAEYAKLEKPLTGAEIGDWV